MSFDARAHVFYNIANAPLLNYPFPHFYLESVFPEDYYQALLANLPPLASYVPLAETGTVLPETYKERFALDPQRLQDDDPLMPQAPFWNALLQWMESDDFSRLLLTKFDAAISARFGPGNDLVVQHDTRLIRDFTNFAIGPHTDSPRKLISLLFYLPRDDRLSHLGTSIYQPRVAGFTCEGTQHHDFADFRKVYTAPFRPNSLLAFCKTDYAFHGVDPIADTDIERNMLLYNVYLNKLTPPVAQTPGRRWPWSRG